jgi:hypothetical protein
VAIVVIESLATWILPLNEKKDRPKRNHSEEMDPNTSTCNDNFDITMPFLHDVFLPRNAPSNEMERRRRMHHCHEGIQDMY